MLRAAEAGWRRYRRAHFPGVDPPAAVGGVESDVDHLPVQVTVDAQTQTFRALLYGML